MTGPLFYLFAAFLAVLQLALPRRVAFMPLLGAVFFLGNVSLAGDLTPVRLVLFVGLVRAACGGFLRWSTANPLDLWFLVFAGFALLSSFGHEANEYVPSPLFERLGLVCNIFGAYLYGRAYLHGPDLIRRLGTGLAAVVIPFGLMLMFEQLTGRNAFTGLGALAEEAGRRGERMRAFGPFSHPILAGTAAAAALPFLIAIWRSRPKLARAGLVAVVLAVVASASSGPIGTLLCGAGLMVFWRWRGLLGQAKVAGLAMLVFLHFAMSRPVWFLIAKADVVGGSTGWHRSALIDTAIKRLDEWWLAGTDETRHWIFSGVGWNPNHTDITNYYLLFGVLGGLPLMLAFIAILVSAIRRLERTVRDLREMEDGREFEAWCLWAALFAHTLSFLAVAYFDQSFALFFMTVGCVPGVAEWAAREATETRPEPAAGSPAEDPPATAAWGG